MVFLFAVSLLSFIPQGVQAQGGLVPCGRDSDDLSTIGIDESQDCQICHFFVMLDRILKFIFLILVPAIAVLMLVIGGVMFFFAGGSPQRLGNAKSIITSVVTGLVIIFAAWIIINTFFIFIGVASWTGLRSGWFIINCPIS